MSAGNHLNARLVSYTKQLNVEHAAQGDVDGARRLIDQMLAEGVVPSVVTANTLIKTYREARMPKGAEAVLREMMLDWGLAADGASYCTVIDAWGLSGGHAEAARVLDAAEAAGAADSRCYAARLRHVMGAEEVAPLLARAERHAVPLELPACNAALAVLAAEGRAAEAEQLVAALMASPGRVRPDPRSHALLLKAHCVGGDVAAAEVLLLALLDEQDAVGAKGVGGGGGDSGGGSGGGGGGGGGGKEGGAPSLTAAVTAVMDGHVCSSPPAIEAASRLMDAVLRRGVKPDTAMFNVLIKGHAQAHHAPHPRTRPPFPPRPSPHTRLPLPPPPRLPPTSASTHAGRAAAAARRAGSLLANPAGAGVCSGHTPSAGTLHAHTTCT